MQQDSWFGENLAQVRSMLPQGALIGQLGGSSVSSLPSMRLHSLSYTKLRSGVFSDWTCGAAFSAKIHYKDCIPFLLGIDGFRLVFSDTNGKNYSKIAGSKLPG